MQLLIKI